MALTKNDCLLLLANLQKQGVDTKEITTTLLTQPAKLLDVVKFINTNRPLDITKFYEKLRMQHNKNKSKLYMNIVKVDEQEPKDTLVTLASLNLQILLFAKQCENPQLFLTNARLTEINAALYNYGKTFDIVPCIKILSVIKADLKAFQSISK